MEPITEARLRRATERAVARGHAIGALLFGSRARGTAGALSDWDVCLVTTEDFPSVEARERALEAEDALWENGNIERVWVHRARFDDGVPVGSLEAAIAREGRTLAGDASMVTRARTVPFEAKTVLENMNRATDHLQVAIGAARKQVRGTDAARRASAMVAMVTSSIAGAEALGRALCALTETEHTGDHRVGKSGRQIADRSTEPNPPLESTLTQAISERVQALNDSVQTVGKLEYGDPGEPYEKTAERFVRALEADLWTRYGLIEGTGPWAGLMHHPRRHELAGRIKQATLAYAIENADEWTLMPFEYPDQKLHDAMRKWVEGYGALREAHLWREERMGNVGDQPARTSR